LPRAIPAIAFPRKRRQHRLHRADVVVAVARLAAAPVRECAAEEQGVAIAREASAALGIPELKQARLHPVTALIGRNVGRC
jgi:hypothetical protein